MNIMICSLFERKISYGIKSDKKYETNGFVVIKNFISKTEMKAKKTIVTL